MKQISDIDDAERRVIESTLRERYGERVATGKTGGELRDDVDPDAR